MIKEICEPGEKKRIARVILEALPEWFGIPEAREEYIAESEKLVMFADIENGVPAGLVTLRETGRDTAELNVMGVAKPFHRRGIGTALFLAARAAAAERGYSFLQVKTVQEGHYSEYDATNSFYRSVGFKEFELFPTLWDENNPCMIYVMSLK